MKIIEHVMTKRDHSPILEPVRPAPQAPHTPRTLAIDPAATRQTWIGFGGAFTEAAASVWSRLPRSAQRQVLDLYFDHRTGARYSLCRSHINSCDFALGNYACVERPGDTAFESFNLKREQTYLFPMIRAAGKVSSEPIRLLLSPWSPPAWMKTNGDMNHGGKLLPEHWDTWARLMAHYLRSYREAGLNLWGLTVQNEPHASQTWDSCLYTHDEQRDFVRDHLGPRLREAGLSDLRLLIWDHNKDELQDAATTILGDPAAKAFVWGVGFHWYTGDHFDQLDRVHEAHPDIDLVFTEGCQEGGPHRGSWDVAERYGHEIIGDINHWTSGWIDWNMLLDTHGGPNHVGNFCSAPVLADVKTGSCHVQPSYAYIAHASRYIRPDALILTVDPPRPLEACAARNPDGTIAVVVMNATPEPLDFRLQLPAHSSGIMAPARSIQTIVLRE